MQYCQMTIVAPAVWEEQVSLLLFSQGAQAVEIDDPRLIAEHLRRGDWDASVYADAGLEPEQLQEQDLTIRAVFSDDEPGREAMQAVAQALSQQGACQISYQVLADQDWQRVWRERFQPLPIGESLLVNPVWLPVEADTQRLVIQVNPGAAFGTGDHSTTAMTLELIERWLPPGGHFLDIGCGSGILTVAALRLGARSACCVDIDAAALQSTQEHLQLNGLEDAQVTLLQGDIISDQFLQRKLRREKADLIAANLTASLLMDLMPFLPRLMASGAYFVCSGVISEYAADVAQMIVNYGMTVIERRERDGWVAFTAVSAGE